MTTLRVRIAPGADPSTDPSTWTWVDVTAWTRAGIQITRGRQSRDGQTPPSRCVLNVDNAGGRFTPQHPLNPWYPLLRRNCPINVQVLVANIWYDRFTGFVDSFPVQWGPTDTTVQITASGITRRLSQGDAPTQGALYRAVMAQQTGLMAYWPLEDGSDADQASSAVPGVGPLVVVGSAQFGQSVPLSGVTRILNPRGAYLVAGSLPGGTQTSWRVECVVMYPNLVPVSGRRILSWLSTGSATAWNLEFVPAGFRFRGFAETASTSTLVQDVTTSALPIPNRLHHLRADTSVSGGNMVSTLYLDGVQIGTATLAGGSCTPPRYIRVNPDANNDDQTPYVGHTAIWSPPPGSSTTALAASGRVGDTAADRMAAVSAEYGVPLDTIASGASTELLGAAPVGTYMQVMRDAESTDGGILVEQTSGRLGYVPRVDLYNRSPSMVMTFSQLADGFDPVSDDAQLVNDVTAQRPGGTDDRYVDAVSVAAEGRYQSTITVSPQNESRLINLAAWAVHLGTVNELRYPALSVNLVGNPALQAGWVGIDPGDRVQVTGLPANLPPGPIDVLVQGYTETLDAPVWRVEVNVSPFSPYLVGVRGTDLRDTAGSQLAAGVNATATSLSVATTSGPLWVTGAVNFAADVAGELVTVTNIAGSTSPQTFTVVRSVNGISKAQVSGAIVRLYRPAVRAL